METADLTTKDVARLLHVSEATVKRWADDGVLRPEKTVGGHRRFSIQAIARLRRERGMEADRNAPASKTANEERGVQTVLSPSIFSESLLRGDESKVSAGLINAYLHNHTLASLFDTTITKAMHEIGEMWVKGKITIADEHLATRVLLSALQKLRAVVVPAEPTGLKAICCAIEGDLHELPVHLAEIIIEAAGWEAVNLGANTPLFALREMVAQKRPGLVCVSARTVADLDRAAIEYAQLRKVTQKMGAVIVLGGEGFRDTTLRARFPSDFYVENFAGLSKFIRLQMSKRV